MDVVLLTGSEKRHSFFRIFISNVKGINVKLSVCESQTGNIQNVVRAEQTDNLERLNHLELRAKEESESFSDFIASSTDFSNPIFIEKGAVNDRANVDMITDMKPAVIIAYGCSIIRSSLLDLFQGRFINLHLGISPYYRGSGTNFWPFVNRELQFVGTTFMFIDEGIDTGQIIHQIRARFEVHDNIHSVGNRLIKDSAKVCVDIIKKFHPSMALVGKNFPQEPRRIYKKKDFTEQSIKLALNNISQGMVSQYLANKVSLSKKFPIITNPILNVL